MVRAIYVGLPQVLHVAAGRSVLPHLIELVAEDASMPRPTTVEARLSPEVPLASCGVLASGAFARIRSPRPTSPRYAGRRHGERNNLRSTEKASESQVVAARFGRLT